MSQPANDTPTLTAETVEQALGACMGHPERLRVSRVTEGTPGLAVVHYELDGQRGLVMVADTAHYDLADLPVHILPPVLTGECRGLVVLEDGRFLGFSDAERLLLAFRLTHAAEDIVTAIQDYFGYRRAAAQSLRPVLHA